MKFKIAILQFIFCFLSLTAFSQDHYDKVFLNNGSFYVGEIQSYKQGEALIIKLTNKQLIEIPESDIQRIVQAVPRNDDVLPDPVEKKEIKVDYKTKGWYNTTFIAFAAGNDGGSTNEGGSFKLGSGLHNITGRQFNHFFGLGLGVGLDNYSRRGETVLPVYLELRGYPSKKNPKIYYSISGGYGFTFKRESFGITETDGGYMVHPALGFRIGTPDATNINIDIGMKFQDAFFLEQLLNGDIEERTVTFNRITLRVGLTLWK